MGEPYKGDILNFLHTPFDANYEPMFPAVMRVVSDYDGRWKRNTYPWNQ